MKRDVLDRACESLWLEIRALVRRHHVLLKSSANDSERRAVVARITRLRAQSARYREVQRREGWAGWDPP